MPAAGIGMIFNLIGKIAAVRGTNSTGFGMLRHLAQFLKRVLVAPSETGCEWQLNAALTGCLPERLLP
tara:strand:- start:455 stop:658 length:204 start_codon:yes stop_codon:yes gene_type:complete